MKKYRLSPAAEGDLDDIWNYTAIEWSADQADRYISHLFDAFARLGDHPGIGQLKDDIKPGYRRFKCAHHLVFYVLTDEGPVNIARILHEKSDALRHLDPSE